MTDEPTAPDADDAADTDAAERRRHDGHRRGRRGRGARPPARRRHDAHRRGDRRRVPRGVRHLGPAPGARTRRTGRNRAAELLENPAIRGAVSAYLVDQLYANVNVQGELRNALPPQFKGLSGPAAGALRNVAGNVANQALERPRVQALWEEANRRAHQRLLQVIKGGNGAVSTSGGVVSLDLGALLSDVSSRTGVGGPPGGQAAAGRGEHRDPAVGPAEGRAEHRERHQAARDHPDGARAAAVRTGDLARARLAARGAARRRGRVPDRGDPRAGRPPLRRDAARRLARDDGRDQAGRAGRVGHRDLAARQRRGRDHRLRHRRACSRPGSPGRPRGPSASGARWPRTCARRRTRGAASP